MLLLRETANKDKKWGEKEDKEKAREGEWQGGRKRKSPFHEHTENLIDRKAWHEAVLISANLNSLHVMLSVVLASSYIWRGAPSPAWGQKSRAALARLSFVLASEMCSLVPRPCFASS